MLIISFLIAAARSAVYIVADPTLTWPLYELQIHLVEIRPMQPIFSDRCLCH
jgi:hypothetical protein